MKRLSVGVDVGGTNLKALIVDDRGSVVSRAVLPTGAAHGPDVVISNIVKLIDLVISNSGIDTADLLGVGIGAPGPLNPVTGIVYMAPNLPGWKDVPLEDGVIKAEHIYAELGEICAGLKPGRTSPDEVTLFKSVGVAVQDVAAASAVLKAAKRQGLGTEVEI